MELKSYTIKKVEGKDVTVEFTYVDELISEQIIGNLTVSNPDLLHGELLNYAQAYRQGLEIEKLNIVHPDIEKIINQEIII